MFRRVKARDGFDRRVASEIFSTVIVVTEKTIHDTC